MLGRLAEIFPQVPRLAVTATADARTREDIRAELRLEDAREFVDSFARPELALSAERKRGAGPRAGAGAGGRAAGPLGRDLCRLARRRRQAGREAGGRRRAGARLSRRPRQGPARRPAGAVPRGRRRRDGGHHRLRHGRRQAGRALRHPRRSAGRRSRPTGRRSAAPGATAHPAEGITLYSASDLAWALRRIDSRDVDDGGQGRADAQGAPALRHARRHRLPRRPPCAATSARTGVAACGQCDLCLNPPEAVDATEAAQKALSAVHRLGGRFGRGRVVDHLLGKTKDAVDSETALSTCGIGREFSAAGWRDLIDQLLFEGLLREDPNDGRPLIGLGEADEVKAVYRGERRVVGAPDARRRGGRRRPRGPRAQAPRRRAAAASRPRTRPCSRPCAPGAASARPSSTCRPTSSSTTPRCRPSPASGRRAPTPWRRSAASARASSSATAPTCSRIVREN